MPFVPGLNSAHEANMSKRRLKGQRQIRNDQWAARMVKHTGSVKSLRAPTKHMHPPYETARQNTVQHLQEGIWRGITWQQRGKVCIRTGQQVDILWQVQELLE